MGGDGRFCAWRSKVPERATGYKLEVDSLEVDSLEVDSLEGPDSDTAFAAERQKVPNQHSSDPPDGRG